MSQDHQTRHGRDRRRTVGLAAAALGAAAVVTLAAVVVVKPLVAPPTSGSGPIAALAGVSQPVPIVGPITPAGHPYDVLSILRRQRLSTDVLPAGATKDLTGVRVSFVPESARLLATDGKDRTYVAASTTGGVCELSVENGGYSSGCSDSVSSAAGGLVSDVGFASSDDIKVFADGLPSAKATAGYRQIEQNVWLKTSSKAVPAPSPASSPGDPLAFPAVAPYSEFGILRRPAAASDAIPAAVVGDSSILTDVVVTSLRKAGSYRGTTVWVAASLRGGACLVVAEAGSQGLMTACGGPTGGVGVAAGDNGSLGSFTLVTDQADATRGGGVGGRRLAPDVWFTPPPS